MTTTLESIRKMLETSTGTEQYRALNGIIDLVEFQRGLYGDAHVSQIVNVLGYAIVTVNG